MWELLTSHTLNISQQHQIFSLIRQGVIICSGEKSGNPLVFLPENPMSGEAWHATVQRVVESDTTEPLSTHTIHLKILVVVWRKILEQFLIVLFTY